MKIEVTLEDIDNGVRGHPCKCPVALALRRLGVEGEVSRVDVVLLNDQTIPLPEVARCFVGEFDEDKEVEPFSFELPITLPTEQQPTQTPEANEN